MKKKCYFCPCRKGLRRVKIGHCTFFISMCRRCRAEVGQS